jgi:hypothetical protein
VGFSLGKPLAALRSLTQTKEFFWASATSIASWAGLGTRYNPVPMRFPAFPYLWVFCSHAVAVYFRTPYSSPAILALDPPSARVMTRLWTDLSWWAFVKRMKKE